MTRRFSSGGGRRAFTLIELLAACVAFAILITMLLQVFGSVSTTAGLAQRRLEILKQVVGAMERMRFDLQGLLANGNARLWVEKNENGVSDALYFAAPVAASSRPQDARKLSLVRFGIEPRPPGSPSGTGWPETEALSRTVFPVGWDEDIGPVFSGKAKPAAKGETQQIAPGLVRYEVCFQLWDGAISATAPEDWRDIRALICGVVAIDRVAASRVSANQLRSLAGHFPDPKPGQRPAEAWAGSLDGLPKPIRETLRVYEEVISI